MTMPSRCPACSSASRRAKLRAPTRMSSRASTTPGSMRRARSPTHRWSGSAKPDFFAAAMLAHRFCVVTTLSRSVPVLENNLLRYGLDRRCARVRACDVPVLELDNPASGARKKIADEIARALAEDGAEAIVLGCAGMADLAASLGAECGVPVIDGVGSGSRSRRRTCGDWSQDVQARRLRAAIGQGLFRRLRALLAAGLGTRSAPSPTIAAGDISVCPICGQAVPHPLAGRGDKHPPSTGFWRWPRWHSP